MNLVDILRKRDELPPGNYALADHTHAGGGVMTEVTANAR